MFSYAKSFFVAVMLQLGGYMEYLCVEHILMLLSAHLWWTLISIFRTMILCVSSNWHINVLWFISFSFLMNWVLFTELRWNCRQETSKLWWFNYLCGFCKSCPNVARKTSGDVFNFVVICFLHLTFLFVIHLWFLHLPICDWIVWFS